MAGFQSPNYTQTPNDLFDELLPSLGLAELKVVLCVVRHTFGYHKDEAKLSIREIARFTGLTAKSVMEGAEQAEAHGLIERYQDGKKTTLWRAIVSVIPSNTRRDTKYHRTVVPTTTQLPVKESKEIKKEIGVDTPNLPLEWQVAEDLPIQEPPKVKDTYDPAKARDVANKIGERRAGAEMLALAFQDARRINLSDDPKKISGYRKAAAEMLEAHVTPEHIRLAVKSLLEKGMTIVDLFSISKTAIDLANKPAEDEKQEPKRNEFPTIVNGRVVR